MTVSTRAEDIVALADMADRIESQKLFAGDADGSLAKTALRIKTRIFDLLEEKRLTEDSEALKKVADGMVTAIRDEVGKAVAEAVAKAVASNLEEVTAIPDAVVALTAEVAELRARIDAIPQPVFNLTLPEGFVKVDIEKADPTPITFAPVVSVPPTKIIQQLPRKTTREVTKLNNLGDPVRTEETHEYDEVER